MAQARYWRRPEYVASAVVIFVQVELSALPNDARSHRRPDWPLPVRYWAQPSGLLRRTGIALAYFMALASGCALTGQAVATYRICRGYASPANRRYIMYRGLAADCARSDPRETCSTWVMRDIRIGVATIELDGERQGKTLNFNDSHHSDAPCVQDNRCLMPRRQT